MAKQKTTAPDPRIRAARLERLRRRDELETRQRDEQLDHWWLGQPDDEPIFPAPPAERALFNDNGQPEEYPNA